MLLWPGRWYHFVVFRSHQYILGRAIISKVKNTLDIASSKVNSILFLFIPHIDIMYLALYTVYVVNFYYIIGGVVRVNYLIGEFML